MHIDIVDLFLVIECWPRIRGSEGYLYITQAHLNIQEVGSRMIRESRY